jgi:triosephosphate isomerase
MRTPLIAANWKMNKTVSEAVQYLNELRDLVYDIRDAEIVVCAPFTCLHALKQAVGKSQIKLGAQDVYFEEKGAYTGQISPIMLKELVQFVIIGHSERRRLFGETNDSVNKKIRAALRYGLKPIVCIGETLEERKKKKTFKVLEKQMKEGFMNLTKAEMLDIVIAYEPIWAISGGDPNHAAATPDDAQQAHSFIRQQLGQMFDEETKENLRIIYGGSAKPENIKLLMNLPDVDGALPGTASLDADSFSAMIHFKQ